MIEDVKARGLSLGTATLSGFVNVLMVSAEIFRFAQGDMTNNFSTMTEGAAPDVSIARR